ncbi:MAG: AMP-binding protein, partial [Prolixibacteraceae bacterium]
KHDLSSLKVLGTVGEPINEEAWRWYHDLVGKGKCPIVDTWWQTETGGIMISPIAGVTPTKPSLATLPLPGVQPILVNPEGEELKGNGVEGILCINIHGRECCAPRMATTSAATKPTSRLIPDYI